MNHAPQAETAQSEKLYVNDTKESRTCSRMVTSELDTQ